MVRLWKSHNLDKRALGTYMRVTVYKGKDKCTFTLSLAMIFVCDALHYPLDNPLGNLLDDIFIRFVDNLLVLPWVLIVP